MGEETETATLDPRNLRVSDEEREHVVTILQKAIGRGLLDLDEFTQRTDIALAARTRGELNGVLVDIPGMVNRDLGAPPPSASSDRRLVLTAKYSSLVRNGQWLVPSEVVVNNKFGSTKLDFSEAQVSSPTVRIELDCKWGSVEVIIPEHASVDLNEITELKYGSLEDKTASDGRAGTPRFVFTGRVHGGSLVIKHPRRGLFS
ncbi:hypothetical protein FHX82_000212 [Amycolatopsis bartoniae]|uniref:DUF1707 domain-containing protein n=1 Tax=Amycolatopsis bartoniae TaxID=941986 RepID=A0A8H9ITG1_9PSEU|nr:DUF1707 domain-containing protein [Amycolatopsis bartoniae]MBB2933192.1 hypothetical protein [Amycolatopsis bartoniae]TVT11817.1 DUF1707 domain-containing protein [Amycolatopsis bartoniae]GHF57735.1 hypothetical protein GCM10017566_33730 [Amycolatopsis bartoniae]